VIIDFVPAKVQSQLREACDSLDLTLFKALKTQWGESKRLQATYGTQHCEISSYKFSRLDNKIIPASGALLALIESAAATMKVTPNKVIAHVNYYPENTSSGCAAHQDDEHCIDQRYPIIGYQIGGPATFHAWSGPPGDRPGAKVQICADQYYVMPAGFQLNNWHAITRNKMAEKNAWRCNITFRAVVATH
jgi:hypothetical protein